MVAGRAQWDRLLDRLAREHDFQADLLQESYDQAMAERAARDDVPPADDIAGDMAGDEAVEEALGEAEPAQPPSGVRRERRLADRAHELRRLALAIVDAVDDARSRPAPWSERVAWLRAVAGDVVGGRPERRDDWPPDEVRAADSIEAALDRLAALDAVDHPPTLEVFRRTLELELDADLGRVGRLGEGVLVGPLSFAVGLDLDLVVVLGMAEGTLPATVHDDSLLPDVERIRAGDQLPLRRERVGREHRRLLAALAAADRHLLCLPRGDLRASSERVPSRWLLDVAGVLAGEPVASGALLAAGVPGLEVVPSFAHAVAHTSVPATDQEYRLRVGATRCTTPWSTGAQGSSALAAARRSPASTATWPAWGSPPPSTRSCPRPGSSRGRRAPSPTSPGACCGWSRWRTRSISCRCRPWSAARWSTRCWNAS